MKPKSKNAAFFLSFLLPGAGFLYLRKWKLAALNFFGAVALGVVLSFVLPEAFQENYGRYIAMAIGGGSGGWAMGVAEQMNEEAARVPTMEELSEQSQFS